MLLFKDLMQFSLSKTTVFDLSTNILIQWSLSTCKRSKLFAKLSSLMIILLLKQGVSVRSCLRSSFVVFELFDSTWMRIFIVISLPYSIMTVHVIQVSFAVTSMQCLFGLSLLTVFILLDCNWSEGIEWTYLNSWFDAHLVIIDPSTYLWATEGKAAVLWEFKATIAKELWSVQFAIRLSWIMSPLIDSFSDQSTRRLSHLSSMDKISVFSWAAFMRTWSVDGFLMKVLSWGSILIIILFKGTFHLIWVKTFRINTMKN